MPLVIIVFVIVAVVVIGLDSSKSKSRTLTWHENWRRKTNAHLEQALMSRNLLYGLSFNEAYRKTCQQLTEAGYEPCINISEYEVYDGVWSSATKGFLKDYDSLHVKGLKEEAYKKHPFRTAPHPLLKGVEILAPSDLELFESVYRGFPTNEWEYIRAVKQGSLRTKVVPVGGMLVYVGYGTCEVVSHNYNHDKTSGTYTLRSLKTGEVITVSMDDSGITDM